MRRRNKRHDKSDTFGKSEGKIENISISEPTPKRPYLRSLEPKNEHQREYINAINSFPMVFAIGSAGTGKTAVACFLAAKYLMEGKVDKIVLTRPAVEACGESIGFLPGDVSEKMNFYLVPLYDFLNQALGAKLVKGLIENDSIEIIPLGFIRGRTFTNSFVILDEGQNVSSSLMFSFLTRMGDNSKFVITGDLDQSDIGGTCGLADAKQRLQGLDNIKWIEFGADDVLRHPIVKDIIKRYKV